MCLSLFGNTGIFQKYRPVCFALPLYVGFSHVPIIKFKLGTFGWEEVIEAVLSLSQGISGGG